MSRIWLKTELKRAVLLLPVMLKRAALLVIVCGMAAGAAAFCITAAGRLFDANDESRVKLGIVASDNMLTDMAVAYIEEIESVKAFCSIEQVSDKAEGIRRLQEGEFSALAVLPEDIVNEILSGSNAPVTVYMEGSNTNIKGLLFQELAGAGIGMLETAQAEIYALQYMLDDALFADKELVGSLYDDINKFNLITVTGREKLFRTKTVSVTENDTYVIYYGSALLTLYLLFVGIFFGDFFCRTGLWQSILEKRLGISRAYQIICALIAGLLPMAVTGLLPFAALMVPCVRAHFHVEPWSTLCLMLLVTVHGALYFMLIYGILGEKRNTLLVIGILALIQGYLSGCFVPSALLPDLAYGVGKYLPAAYIKSAFTVILSGDAQRLSSAVSGLLAWSFVFLGANLIWVYSRTLRSGRKEKTEEQKGTGDSSVPPVIWVIAKRMLLRKGIIASLVLMAVISVWIAGLEQHSDTTLCAAVFDESGEYETLLLEHDGLVRFQICESQSEVKELVLKGKAECGYVLPRDLTKDLTVLRANRTVTVFEGVDSVCVPLVNEVLFNVIFRHASLAWYEGYLSEFCQDAALIRKAFDSQINLGKTFGIKLMTLGEDGAAAAAEENKGTYPVLAVVLSAVVLCGIQGLLTAVDDSRRGRYYKKGRGVLAALMVVLPMLAAAVIGSVLLVWL